MLACMYTRIRMQMQLLLLYINYSLRQKTCSLIIIIQRLARRFQHIVTPCCLLYADGQTDGRTDAR